MRTKTKIGWLWGVCALAACTGGNPSLEPGATSFVTEEPAGYGRGGPSGGEVATPSDAANGNDNKAPSGRTGTVEEADIYRVDQNRLFYFNTYRGFIIYDLSDAKHPQRVSRLPVYGYPVEMYVDGNTVYALIRDALYLTQDAGGQKFERHDTSQLVTIDVSDLQHPQVLKTIDIIGQLQEGVSRKIDDTIYVVSHIPQSYYGWWYWDWGWYGAIDTDKEQAWVYSFNVANSANPQLVDKLQVFEGGSAQGSGPSTSYGRYFSGLALSATANTLHVVENWQTYGWVSGSPYNGCGSSYNQQEAVVSIIDISDPSGHIRLHTKFSTYGSLSDQFKQTYVYDPATQHGYYYGIFSRREWSSFACSGSSFTQNNFEAWDVTDGGAPVRVGALSFGKPNETVGGSTFDPARRVAFAITSQRQDPFYAISFADPAHPAIASSIDGLAGDMSVFRFIGGQNKFILGIGRDASDECSGTSTTSTGWHSGVSVSIFDVQNLAAIRLVQRDCVDVKDAQSVSSDVTWNLDQGHKMIGLSEGTRNLVTVPVSYSQRNDQNNWWWYRYSSAIGMMTWDLAAYDPAKPQQTVLVNHGSVEHGHGGVRRTIVFNHQAASGDRRMLLNLSDTYLSLFDIEDVDQPALQAEVEIAPDVEELFRFGGHLVEHVRDEGYGYGYDTASIFRVKPVGGVVDETAPVATFTVGQVQRVMKWKDALVVFRRNAPSTATPTNPYGTETSQLVVFDLSNPAAPQLRSITDLGYSIYPTYRFWCGDVLGYLGGWWWGGGSDWTSFAGGLAFRVSAWDPATNSQLTRLVYVNLADLGAPKLQAHVFAANDRDYLALTADATDPNGFFLSFRDHIGSISPYGDNYQLWQYRYYAQRWSTSGDDIVADAATNVPGQIVRSWKSGDRTLLVTQDSQYTWLPDATTPGSGYLSGDPRLHLLERVDASTAALRGSRVFAGRYLSSLVGEADRIYVTSAAAYGYAYVNGGLTSTPPADAGDRLTIFDTGAQLTLDPAFDGSLGLTGASAMGATGNRLFLNVSGAGVLVSDVTNAAAPAGRTFLRTLGWGSHLELNGATMYVAAGNFGVFQRDLSGSTLAP